MPAFPWISGYLCESFVDILDTWVEQWLVDERMGALASSDAAHAGVKEGFVCTVVLAIIYIGALALRAYVLYSLRFSAQHLHVGTRKGIVRIEKEVPPMMFLEALRSSRSRLFNPFEVSTVVVVVYVGKKVTSV